MLGAFLGLDEGVLKNMDPPYCHVLAMNGVGAAVLKAAKAASGGLPISASLAELSAASPAAARFAELEARGEDLFWLSAPRPRRCGEAFRAAVLKAEAGGR